MVLPLNRAGSNLAFSFDRHPWTVCLRTSLFAHQMFTVPLKLLIGSAGPNRSDLAGSKASPFLCLDSASLCDDPKNRGQNYLKQASPGDVSDKQITVKVVKKRKPSMKLFRSAWYTTSLSLVSRTSTCHSHHQPHLVCATIVLLLAIIFARLQVCTRIQTIPLATQHACGRSCTNACSTAKFLFAFEVVWI